MLENGSRKTAPQHSGTRELGVLVDTLPGLRRLLLPRLKREAAFGVEELKKTRPDLCSLQTITFGAIGSCEVLTHSQIDTATCGGLPFKRAKQSQPSYKHVLCVIEYKLESCQGSLERRNRATLGSATVHLGTSIDRVNRAACAEFRALAAMEKVLQKLKNGSRTVRTQIQTPERTPTGTMAISVTEPPCVSCLAAMMHFARKYPEIKIEVSIHGALLRFGEEVGRFKSFSELSDLGDATECRKCSCSAHPLAVNLVLFFSR